MSNFQPTKMNNCDSKAMQMSAIRDKNEKLSNVDMTVIPMITRVQDLENLKSEKSLR